MEEIDTKLEKAQEILDNYENIYGIKNSGVPDNVDKAFSMSYEQVQKLSGEDCAYYSYVLSEYAYYIQKLQNKENTKLKWLNNKLLDLVCTKLDSYDKYMKYEIKVRLIAKENKVVEELLRKINYIEQTIERCNFISSHIKHMSDSFTNIQRAKNNSYYGGKYGQTT